MREADGLGVVETTPDEIGLRYCITIPGDIYAVLGKSARDRILDAFADGGPSSAIQAIHAEFHATEVTN